MLPRAAIRRKCAFTPIRSFPEEPDRRVRAANGDDMDAAADRAAHSTTAATERGSAGRQRYGSGA